MPSKNPSSSGTSRFNVDLLIDVVAGACILVIAGRPDALAITISAVIISVVAVAFRATMGARAYLAANGRGRVSAAVDVPPVRPAPTDAEPDVPPARPDRSSWLRE